MEKDGKFLLHRAGVGEQIFNILKSQIASGELKPGMKISSENELAAQFGVSRMSARNALQRLCAMGLLETKVGEGTFVKEFRLVEYFKEASELMDYPKNKKDIVEFRVTFEKNYLRIACERRTEEDLNRLKEIFDHMMELSGGEDFDSYFDADMDFHQCICDMTHNEIFSMVGAILRDLLVAQLKETTKNYAGLKNVSFQPKDDNYILKVLTKDHIDYIEALEKRDCSIVENKMPYYFNVKW